jgi:hypothetical protein
MGKKEKTIQKKLKCLENNIFKNKGEKLKAKKK